MGRSGHYYRMTLASCGGRPRLVQLLSIDRDGMIPMRIYRRRQGRWVYHEEYHRDISDTIYLGKYYNVGEHNHSDYEYRDSCSGGIYYAYFSYFNYPLYTVPVYPETDHQVDRNISRKEKRDSILKFFNA